MLAVDGSDLCIAHNPKNTENHIVTAENVKGFKISEKYNIRTDLIKYVFKFPVFDIVSIQKKLGISNNTVRNNVNKLIQSGKIYPDDKKRNKTYRFYDLLDIMRS